MDKRCYLWIFKNINKYSFTDDALSIKDDIGRLLITEESVNLPDIAAKMESCYNRLVADFYNNIIVRIEYMIFWIFRWTNSFSRIFVNNCSYKCGCS